MTEIVKGPADNLFVDDRHKLLKIAPESLPTGLANTAASARRTRRVLVPER